MLTALAGGVGAARFLGGVAAVLDPSLTNAVVNTGDDVVVHGLHVSPDLDTVTYTLAGAISADRGWGLESETWSVMETLDHYSKVSPSGSAAGDTWFRLGDRDLATHLYRTQRLAEGAPLSAVAAEIGRAWDVRVRLLPMTDDRVETRVVVSEGEIGFQEYFVGRRHDVPVTAVRFAGVERARPAPGVLEAIERAHRVVICPSNPLVSIGPILAVPGIADAVRARRADCVAVSPIVAGRALKGPADRMLRELGHEPSVIGVARLYAPVAGTLVIDEADRPLARGVEEEGMRAVVTRTVMAGPEEAAALAKTVLDL